MFERKLIRHPYGHEEILIVDGAVLRQHDLPKTGITVFVLAQRMFVAMPDLFVLFQDLLAEKKQLPTMIQESPGALVPTA